MRLLLLLLGLTLGLLPARAGEVYFSVLEMTGGTNDVIINVKPVNNPVLWNNEIYYLPRDGTNLATIGGVVTNTFIPGAYQAVILGLPKAWKLYVTNNPAPVSAVALSREIVNYSGVQSITGYGITVQTDDQGHVTLISPGGGTNGGGPTVWGTILGTITSQTDLVHYIGGELNAASNVLRGATIAATNDLYSATTSDLNNASNILSGAITAATNTLAANVNNNLLSASNALQSAIGGAGIALGDVVTQMMRPTNQFAATNISFGHFNLQRGSYGELLQLEYLANPYVTFEAGSAVTIRDAVIVDSLTDGSATANLPAAFSPSRQLISRKLSTNDFDSTAYAWVESQSGGGGGGITLTDATNAALGVVLEATNDLYSATTSDLNNASNILSGAITAATNTLAANVNNNLLSASNALHSAIGGAGIALGDVVTQMSRPTNNIAATNIEVSVGAKVFKVGGGGLSYTDGVHWIDPVLGEIGGWSFKGSGHELSNLDAGSVATGVLSSNRVPSLNAAYHIDNATIGSNKLDATTYAWINGANENLLSASNVLSGKVSSATNALAGVVNDRLVTASNVLWHSRGGGSALALGLSALTATPARAKTYELAEFTSRLKRDGLWSDLVWLQVFGKGYQNASNNIVLQGPRTDITGTSRNFALHKSDNNSVSFKLPNVQSNATMLVAGAGIGETGKESGTERFLLRLRTSEASPPFAAMLQFWKPNEGDFRAHALGGGSQSFRYSNLLAKDAWPVVSLVFTHDATNKSTILYTNGIVSHTDTYAHGAPTNMATVEFGSARWNYAVAGIWSRPLSGSEVTALEACLRDTVLGADTEVIIDGDSILKTAAGSPSESTWSKFVFGDSDLSATSSFVDLATGGHTTVGVLADLPATLLPYVTNKVQRRIYIIDAGTNDIGAWGSGDLPLATVKDRLMAIYNCAKTNGCYVVGTTLLQREWLVDRPYSDLTDLNTWIRSLEGGVLDAVLDLDAEFTSQVGGSYWLDTDYFADGVHPSAASQNGLRVMRDAVQRIAPKIFP